jgi:spore coat polysaccharide biosynthesis predicted glycosyltransferase SpsG
MLAADAAICAGGVTALELASLGVPSVIMTTADNQEIGAAALVKAGAAIRARSIGEAAKIANDLMTNPAQRTSMAAAGRVLIDGQGVQRVASALHTSTPNRENLL